MARPVRITVVTGCALLAVVMALLVVSGTTEEAAAAEETCCFTNPRFTGVCRVTPAEDETCESILAYLNNPHSVGKAYCGNTKVRMGWKQIDCEE